MSTKADDLKREYEKSIDDTIDSIEEFVRPDTFGIDDYKQDYIEGMEDILHQLRKIRRKMIQGA